MRVYDMCTFISRLDRLHETSRQALRTVRMPTRQTEEFRFTDLGLITSSQLQVAPRSRFQPVACPPLDVLQFVQPDLRHSLQAANGQASADQLHAAVQDRALSDDVGSIQARNQHTPSVLMLDRHSCQQTIVEHVSGFYHAPAGGCAGWHRRPECIPR